MNIDLICYCATAEDVSKTSSKKMGFSAGAQEDKKRETIRIAMWVLWETDCFDPSLHDRVTHFYPLLVC